MPVERGSQNQEPQILSPEDPYWVVIQNLHDASDPSGAYFITVHAINTGGSAMNFWLISGKEGRTAIRVIPEAVSDSKPTIGLLEETLTRFKSHAAEVEGRYSQLS